jgi:hypothetical protein
MRRILLLAAAVAHALAYCPCPGGLYSRVRLSHVGARPGSPISLERDVKSDCAEERHATVDRRRALHDVLRDSVLLCLGSTLAGIPVWAERDYTTMRAAKKSYVPRLTKGVEFYEGALRQAIDAKDWQAVSQAVRENGGAWNLAHVDTYTQGVVGGVIDLKGPLKIFAVTTPVLYVRPLLRTRSC